MRERPVVLRCAVAGAAILLAAPRAGHASGFLSGPGHTPVEQRAVLSVGPDRSTLWVSLRLDGGAGPVAMVVPAAPGAALDWSSAAWIEALEVATAPRILPPPGDAATCPGDPPGSPFHVAADLGHVAPLFPAEVAVLADAPAVEAWAAQNGLAVSAGLATAMAGFAGQRFVAARFSAPAGPTITPTLRVVAPAVSAELPFVLTQAGAAELLLTTWVLGAGPASIEGAPAASVDPADLTFDAATAGTDYLAARAAALGAAGGGAAMVEAASHEALVVDAPIAGGTATIDGLITAYFERAATYGDGLPGAAGCAMVAASAAGSTEVVAASCPRSDLGVVEGTDTCVESAGAGETDPADLRCGAGADDLAVALSGLSPAGAWLTRITQLLPAGAGGSIEQVSFPGGAPISPVLTAGKLDLSGCGPATTTTATTTSSGTTATSTSAGPGPSGATSAAAGGSTFVLVPVYSRGPSCGCSGTYEIVDYVETEAGLGGGGGAGGGVGGGGGEIPDAYYTDEDCGGDTTGDHETEPADDGGCGSDTAETQETGGGDDCEGDPSDSGAGGGGDGRGGGASDGESGSGGETAGDGTSSDCAVTRPRARGGRARLSTVVLAALALVAPLRRLTRRRHRGKAARPPA